MGGKQYYSLLDKVFNEKYYEPNPLHEEIFKLNPHHIITTNYDCLLEDEMVKQNKKYHIIISLIIGDMKQVKDIVINTHI